MEQQGNAKIGHRYATIIVVIILLLISLIAIRVYIRLIVNTYFSNYNLDISYIADAVTALVATFGAYVIYRALLSIIALNIKRGRLDEGSAELTRLILRIIFYAAVIIIVLSAFGVSLGDALAGGAIGGIVLGLAVQTIASNILAGILVSSSRTVVLGEVVVMRSGTWGSTDIIGKVTKISILYTHVLTPNGTTMKFPNSILFNSAVFTGLRVDNDLRYPLTVNVNTDVSPGKLMEIAKDNIKARFIKLKTPMPEVYFSSKGSSADTYTVIIITKQYSDLNLLTTEANLAFSEAYWQLKSPPPPKQKKK